MAIGTINASGFFLISVAMPPMEKDFIFPVLVLVPSGKIKADQFLFFMLFARFRISAMDCFGSFRSIFAAPPYFKFKEMLGIRAFISSILEMNFPWNLLKKNIKGGMS